MPSWPSPLPARTFAPASRSRRLLLLDRLLDCGDASALTHLLRGQALGLLGRVAEAARAMRFYVAARAEENYAEGR